MPDSHAHVPVRPSSGVPTRRAQSMASPASARIHRPAFNKFRTTDNFQGIAPTLPPRPGTSLGMSTHSPEALRPHSARPAPRPSSQWTPSEATGEDARQWSPSDQSLADPEDHEHPFMQPTDGDQDASSVVASDGAEVGEDSPMTAKSATKSTSRRVTFIEAPAPQGSAQAAAKFNRQRQRSQVMTTLRRADQLTPRSTWSMSVSPQATPRDAAALQETRARAFPSLAGMLETVELDPPVKDVVKSDVDTQASLRKQQMMPGEESSDPHLKSLPKHVKGLWSIYHPEEELCDESHGALVQALAGGTTFDQDSNLAELELQRIKTGEDAIAFFATHGDSTDVKVMYARRAEVGITEFRPYDLVLVSEKERGSEFFMISAKGVVHICPGRLSEHTTLSDWMHQTMIFSVLTSMTFFRHYIASKAFGIWRTSARHLAYSALRTRLSRRLFLGKPIFVEAQARIHSLLYSVGATRLITLDATGRALELQPFLTHQKELCALSEFEAKTDAVTEVVDAVLDTISNAGRAEQESDRKPKRLKGRSVAAERKDSQLRVHRRRLQEFNVSLLGNFVRVVDVMLQSRLVDLVVSQAAELLDRLEKSPKIFSVSINFREAKDHMDFAPDRQGFVQGLAEVLDQAVELVGSVAPLATSRKYDDHFRHHDVSPSRASDVIKKNNRFQATKQAIMGRVELDFAKAQREADEYYGPYRKIYDYGHAWDQESFEARQLSHIELADEMSLMKRFEEELEKLKSVHVSGFLLIQARTLRDTLVPVVDGGLQMMKARLRSLARDNCKATYEQFDHVNRDLQQRPQRLEQFAEYVRSYRWTQARWHELDGMKNAVEEMYSMIRQYGIRVEMNEEVTKEALNQKVVMLEITTWPEATAFVEDLLKARTDEVMQRITAIETEAVSMKSEFKTGIFADVLTIDEPIKVIEKLEQMEERLAELSQNAAWLNNCLELFLQAPMPMKRLSETMDAHERQIQLWEIALQWNRSASAWLAYHPQGLDIFPIRGKLEGFDEALAQMHDVLLDDEIVAELQDRVKTWQGMLPALMHLANPALGPTHWSKILDPLAIAALPTEVTIKMLKAAGLFGAERRGLQGDLPAISAGASAEAGLISLVEGVVLNWDEQEVALSCAASDIDLWILADQSEILDFLESDLTSLQVVLSSPHLTESIEVHAKEWQKKLQRAKETLQLWLSIQEQYVLFVSFFEDGIQWDNRSLAALAPVQDYFKPADKVWRQLLSRARTNYRTVMALTSQSTLVTQLKKLSQDLDLAESKLNDFLELQRRTCPRLHLIDDRQLLVALSTAARHGMAAATKTFAPNFFPCSAGLQVVSNAKGSTDEHQALAVLEPQQSVDNVVMELLSVEGEFLTLKAQALDPPHLSEWLQSLSATCQNTLREALQVVMEDASDMAPAEMIQAWLGMTGVRNDALPVSLPGQVLLLAQAVQWSHCVETVLPSHARSTDTSLQGDSNPAMDVKAALESSWWNTQQVIELLKGCPKGQCIDTAVQRAVVGAALLQLLRQHHVLETLTTGRDHTPLSTSFEWQRYLRMQWDVESKRALARLLDWSVDYGYEFIGASPRLVVTPETERNYVGLVGGLRSQMAIAIGGPSGAGKAETVRELARLAAIPVLEINCAASWDTTSAARVFSGLASLGAWGVFHVTLEKESMAVLATFAQTLQSLTEARRAGLSTLELDNSVVVLDQQRPPEVFMVLRGSGSCRPPVDLASLPAAFHALIRPLAVAAPSLIAVAEALFLVEGFANESKKLAKKIVCFLDNLSLQLTDASCTAGASIHAVRRATQLAGQLMRSRERAEQAVSSSVVEALATFRCSTRGPVSNDPAWDVLLTDIFHEAPEALPSGKRGELGHRIQSHLIDYGVLPPNETPTSSVEARAATEQIAASSGTLRALTLRALDIHEQVCHGHAVVVTGGALSGKSAVLSAIAAVGHACDDAWASGDHARKFDSLPEPLQLIRFFPAALSRPEWSGISDGTRCGEKSGLFPSFLQSLSACSPLASLSAETSSEGPGPRHLVVLDAELDASWAEELCPALVPDEPEGAERRRQICFGGNTWVQVPPNVSFIFETQGLAGASPAFCARTSICSLGGVLTLSQVMDQYSERLKSSARLSEHRAHQIMIWIRRFLDAGALSIVRSAMQLQICSKELIDQVDLEHASRMLHLMYTMLCETPGEDTAEAEKSRELVEVSVIFAIAWGLGGGLDDAGRKELGAFMIQALESQEGLPIGFAVLHAVIQSPENLWKFRIVVDEAGVHCLPLKDVLLGLSPLKDAPELLATEETEAVRTICEQLALSNGGFFLCGPRLGGKSAAAERILRHSGEIGWQSMLFRCPIGVSGCHLSSFFRSKLEHQPVMSLGPSCGGRCTAIIDDVHLASGTLPERLREMVNLGGFNDSKTHSFFSVHRVQFGVVGSPHFLRSAHASIGEARNARWLRHFQPVHLQEPGVDSMKHIYTSLLAPWTKQLSSEMQEHVSNVIENMVSLLPVLHRELPLHPNRIFVACSLFDVFQFCRGLCHGAPRSELTLNRLVFHEVSRQFHDRLRYTEDREAFSRALVDAGITTPSGPEPIFANVVSPEVKVDLYTDLGGSESASEVITEALEAALQSFHLPVVLFADLVASVVSVARSLAFESTRHTGLVLVLGAAGSGKRVCGILGAHLARCHVSKPQALQGRGLCEEFLAHMSKSDSRLQPSSPRTSIVQKGPHVFGPVVDSHLDTACGGQEFLEALDAAVRGAHICMPDAPADTAGAAVDVEPKFVTAGFPHAKVLLCLSPECSSEPLRDIVRTYPAFTACSGAVWLQPWSKSARVEVAESILLPQDRAELYQGEQDLFLNVALAAAELPEGLPVAPLRRCHESQQAQGMEAGSNYACFVASLALLRDRHAARYEELTREKTQLERALGVLMGSQEVASSLADRYELISSRINQEEQMWKAARKSCDDMAPAIAEAQRKAAEHDQRLTYLRDEAVDHEANLELLYETTLPALEDAHKQLQGLSKASILECRLVDVPSEPLAMVIWPVMTALGRNAEWRDVETLLGEKDSIHQIISINPKKLSSDQVNRMDEIMSWSMWGEELDDDAIPGVAFGRCCARLVPVLLAAARKWEELLPQRSAYEQHLRKTQEFESTVKSIHADLIKVKLTLQEKENDVDKHKRLLIDAQDELAKLTPEAANHQQIVEATDDELKEWRTRRLEVKDTIMIEMPGNMLLAAFLVHYTGGLTAKQQDELLVGWHATCQKYGVAVTATASMEDLLKDLGGLNDEVCVADTLASLCVPRSVSMCTHSLITPLVFDPFGIVKPWLEHHCERTKDLFLTYIRTSEPPVALLENVKNALRKNMPVLVEVTDGYLPPVLEQLLHGDIPLSLGNRGYRRLFLLSKHVIRSTQTGAFINFDLTMKDLENLLLDEILRLEVPELKAKLAETRVAHAKASAEAIHFQAKILDHCSGHTGREAAANMDALLGEVRRLKSCKLDAECRCSAAASEVERAEPLVAKWRLAAEIGAALHMALLDAEKWHSLYQCNWSRFQQWFRQAFQDAMAKVIPGHAAGGNTQQARIVAFTRAAPAQFLEVMALELLPLHRPIFAFCVAVRLAGAKRGLDHSMVAQLLDIVSADEAALLQLDLTETGGDDHCECLEFINPISWLRLRACSVLSPAFQQVLSHIHRHPGIWSWVERAHALTDPDVEGYSTIGLAVPKVDFPHLKRHLHDLDDIHAVFVIISLARRLAVPAIRQFVTLELGQAAARAIADDEVPSEKFAAGVRAMGAPRVLIALSERRPGMDSNVDLEACLTGLANEEGVPLSVLSGAANGFLERAEREFARRQQYHGWILILDVMECKQIARLWELTSSIIDENMREMENTSSFLLAFSVQISPALSTGNPRIPPSILSCTARLAIAPPRSLKGRLTALISDYGNMTGGAESNERSWPNQRAGLVWLYASLASRASLGSLGWSLPYIWTLADLRHASGVLKLVDNDLDLRYGDAAEIVSLLGFGVQLSSQHDRLALQFLIAECVSPQGPLEVWPRVVAARSGDRLPAVAGMEELIAFAQASLPADDSDAFPSYLPFSCGLGSTVADINVTLQNQEAEDLLKMLNGSFWEEEPSSENGVSEVELLGHIEMLQSALGETCQRLMVFTKVKRRLSLTKNIRGKAMQASAKQGGQTDEMRFQQTLQRELHRLSQHLTLVLESLAEVTDVLTGQARSNERVHSVMQSIWRDEVPAVWELAGQDLQCVRMPLGTWAEEMNGRSMFLYDWGQGLEPISFWLGGLACPRDFLTAILQRHAQKTATELDQLWLATRVTPYQAPAEPWCLTDVRAALESDNKNLQSEDVFVHGLALVGACWESTQDDPEHSVCAGICERPQMEAPSWISLLHLVPQLVPQQSDAAPTATAIYRCPVYRRRCRGSGALLELDLPSREAVSDAGQWAAEMARQGVALVCEVPRSHHDHSLSDGGSHKEDD